MERRVKFIPLVQLFMLIQTIYAQRAERDIDVCEPMDESRARFLHIYNPEFPNFPSAKTHCNCTVMSPNDIDLAVSIHFYVSTDPDSLKIRYKQLEDSVTWAGYASNFSSRDRNGGGYLITDSTSRVQVIYTQTAGSRSIFHLSIGVVNVSDELRIVCSQLPVRDEKNSTSEPDGVIHTLESFCSYHIIIILGSMCVAFLLIILVLSIMLCCTVRKSKGKVVFRKNSEPNQPLSNQSSLGLPMESYRVASRIYDDGMAQRTSINDNGLPQRHHSVPFIRNSAAYVNTQDMKLYGNA